MHIQELTSFFCLCTWTSLILRTQGSPPPVGFYPLDGITGLNDTSACRNLPGLSNGTTLVPGYVEEPNTAYRFNGSESSYVRLPTSENFNSRSIGLFAWFKTDNSAVQQTILQFSSVDKLAILLAIDSARLRLTLSPKCEKPSVPVFSNIQLKSLTWYFVGVFYNNESGLVIFWKSDTDGTVTWEKFLVGNLRLDSNHDLWLGYGPKSPGALTGSIACVQLYDRALDAEQVKVAQRKCLPKDWSEPLAMYALDRSDLALDISGNANPNGTVHFVVTKSGPYNGRQSVEFQGKSASYIRIPHSGKLKMDSSFSITVWIYRYSFSLLYLGDRNIVTFISGDKQPSGLKFDPTKLYSLVGTLYFPSTQKAYKLGHGIGFGDLLPNIGHSGWYHVALIYNFHTGYASLYINDDEHDTKFVGSHSVDTSGDMVVGENFLGKVACLQLYKRPLLPRHVQHAKDKCYRENPDPPVCPLNSHMVHSPCSSSSSATSHASSDRATSSSYVITSLAFAVKMSSYESVTSPSKISLSTLRTFNTSTVTPTSNNDIIVSSMLMVTTSNISFQSTTVVESAYVSSVDNSKYFLTTMSLTHASNISITTATSSSTKDNKTKPLLSPSSLLYESNFITKHVLLHPTPTGSIVSSIDISTFLKTITSSRNNSNSLSEARMHTPLGTIKSNHVTSIAHGSHVLKSTVGAVIVTSSKASSSIKSSTLDTLKSLSAVTSLTHASNVGPAVTTAKRSTSVVSYFTPLVTLESDHETRSFYGSRVSKSIMETVVPNPYLTGSTPSSLILTSDVVTTTNNKRSFLESRNPTPSLTLMSRQMSLSTHDIHLRRTVMETSDPSQSLKGTVTTSSIEGHKRPGNWTQWSDWSACSKPCGSGNQSRIRQCNSTEMEDCIGDVRDNRKCNNHSCEAVSLNITAILLQRHWDDSLLVENSHSFRSLESSLQYNVKEMYSSDPRYPDLVDVKLLSCRRGSVIVHFSVVFEAVDSNQVMQLTDGMEREGLLSTPVVLVNMTADRVPSQSPTITKSYLTSATSLRLFWTPVQEPITGYQVAYRSESIGEWKSVYVTPQTLSIQLEKLREGDIYRILVAAFNTSGNGIPSKGVEIRMKEGVPRMAPVVSVSNRTTSSLFVSWTAIPEEYTEGKLQGYHIIYKPIKLADRKVESAASLKVSASATERLEVTLTSLSAFTLYTITVTGFTAQGDGMGSEAVFGETCTCPPTLYTNWALYPPYVTLSGQQPGGIIGELIMDMILCSCGTCQGGHGGTILDFTHNGKGTLAKKASMGGVRDDVDDKTDVSFPIIGHMEDEKYLKKFVFIPVVQSPGIAFITLANKVEEIGIVLSAVKKCWPVLVLSLIIAFIAAVLIWLSEREDEKDSNFPRSFLRGSGGLIWFTLMTMTTVGFGDIVPLKVISRLLTILSILVGLVLFSVFVATLTVSFTVIVSEETGMIYGAKVTALRDSPAHRLGILRNAKVDPTETLIEAFDSLEQGKTEGLLLDAYVAGSRLKDVYRVNKVIDTSKGLGVVLSGNAIVLRYRIRDFVKKNTKLITQIIQNSTSPLEQPDKSVATEKAGNLVNYASSTFRTAIVVTASALAVSFLIGGGWELVRKRYGRKARGYRIPRSKSQRSEMKVYVHNFYIRFSQTYHRLKMKHIKQIQMYHAVDRNQRPKYDSARNTKQ